jgi:condensin complex subunit 1
LQLFLAVLNLDLNRVIVSTSEKATVVSMMTKTVNIIMENAENIKMTSMKDICLSILAISAKRYDHTTGIRTRILHNIKEEHLAEPMAELLHILAAQFDHSDLIEIVLK